mgnify:FL=1
MSPPASAAPALLRVEHADLDTAGARAAVLVLARPDKLNAIDLAMVEQLDAAIDAVDADASVRCVLVTGEGRAFSAGGDLEKYIALQRDPVAFPHFVAELHRVFGRLRRLRVPAVALVNGVTAAGGLELLIACDFAIAARSARIGDAHQNFGQMGGGGVLSLLPRMIGWQRAAELVFSGRFLPAEQAREWGLVAEVVDDDALREAGLAFAREVARKSPLAIAKAKQTMAAIWEERLPLEAGLRLERETNNVYCLTSEDAPEGLDAFAHKRDPRFRGR